MISGREWAFVVAKILREDLCEDLDSRFLTSDSVQGDLRRQSQRGRR